MAIEQSLGYYLSLTADKHEVTLRATVDELKNVKEDFNRKISVLLELCTRQIQ